MLLSSDLKWQSNISIFSKREGSIVAWNHNIRNLHYSDHAGQGQIAVGMQSRRDLFQVIPHGGKRVAGQDNSLFCPHHHGDAIRAVAGGGQDPDS